MFSLREDRPDDRALGVLKNWARDFLMSDHPELGRDGNVCPFTSFGARIDTLRFGVSEARPDDYERVRSELLKAFAQFEDIPHPPKMGVYRAILVAFPNCTTAEGIATLARAQKSLRLTSFLRARMIGVFYPDAPEPGLWNERFRPLRAPIPLVAIRSLVAADAAFVMRHPLLAFSYLYNFPLVGARLLAERALRRA